MFIFTLLIVSVAAALAGINAQEEVIESPTTTLFFYAHFMDPDLVKEWFGVEVISYETCRVYKNVVSLECFELQENADHTEEFSIKFTAKPEHYIGGICAVVSTEGAEVIEITLSVAGLYRPRPVRAVRNDGSVEEIKTFTMITGVCPYGNGRRPIADKSYLNQMYCIQQKVSLPEELYIVTDLWDEYREDKYKGAITECPNP